MTVGIFSLEMSKEQLFLRMLTSEARIDAHRLRGGFLGERDWGRLSQAIGTLSEAKIFIDDTPSIGVLEMRAKCRRLAAEHGLHLVDHRLHAADAGTRAVREPHARARVDFAVAEGAGQGAERADRRAVAAQSRAGDRAPTTGRSSPTCASRAPSSRTPTSCSFIYREDMYADKRQPPPRTRAWPS